MSADDNLYDLLQIELPGIERFEERVGDSRDADLLNDLQIASPCDASWEEMEGDDLVRFCRHCQKNVYNLSQMNRRAAAGFVREAEDQLCVRFYRRRDGTLITDDCPVGWRAARRRLLQSLGGALAAVLGVAWLLAPAELGGVYRSRASSEPVMGGIPPIRNSPARFMGKIGNPSSPVRLEPVASYPAPTRHQRRWRRWRRSRRKS